MKLHRKEARLISAWFVQCSVWELVEIALLGPQEDNCVGGRRGTYLGVEQAGDEIDMSFRLFENAHLHRSEFQLLKRALDVIQFADSEILPPKQFLLLFEVEDDQPHRGCGQTLHQSQQTVKQD